MRSVVVFMIIVIAVALALLLDGVAAIEVVDNTNSISHSNDNILSLIIYFQNLFLQSA